jgi:hypothetical protein
MKSKQQILAAVAPDFMGYFTCPFLLAAERIPYRYSLFHERKDRTETIKTEYFEYNSP